MKNFKTALFSKTKHIGDSIILTSAIAALPSEFKYVDIICYPESKVIFQMSPRVRTIFVVPRHVTGLKKFLEYLIFYKRIFSNKYNIFIQFSLDWRGAFLAFFLNTEISVAKKTKRRGFLWHRAFDLIANVVDHRRPMAEQDTDLLRKAGLYNQPIAPSYQINIHQDEISYVKDWLYKNGLHSSKKIIVIHACSRWRCKEILIETWTQVVQELASKGYEIILTGSKEDYERNLKIKSETHSKINIVDFSFPKTAALFSLSSLLISVDSVSIHLASAVGLNIAAIFGPTDDSIWSPWGVKNKIISLSAVDSPSFACRPCNQDGCGGGKVSYCLIAIEPKRIVSDAISLIS